MVWLIYFVFLSKILTITTLELDEFGLFEVTAFNIHERSLLYKIHTENDTVVFLNGVTNEAATPMKVIVETCCIDDFQNALETMGIEYTVVEMNATNYLMPDSEGVYRWEDTASWFIKRQRKHMNLKKKVITHTFQKREIFIMAIENDDENPAVVLVGGEQGKDWLSTALLFKLADKLLENKHFEMLLEHYNFYIIPILNPDGYVYSMAEDRFWAKNRKAFFPPKMCTYGPKEEQAVGVNLDRNWYFENSFSGDECSSIYLGQRPLSEEETRGLSQFLNKHAKNIMAYINVVGHGNRIITLPYSIPDVYPDNHGAVMDIIMSACEQLNQDYNVTYFYGNTAKFFCNSADWVKNFLNIPVVYTTYLKYQEAYFPQPEHIEPLSLELASIVEHTLMLSKEIYAPLFNNCITIKYNFILTILNIIDFPYFYKRCIITPK